MRTALLAAGGAASLGLPAGRARAGQEPASQKSSGEIIDAYCHFSSLGLIDYLERKSGREHIFRRLFANTPTLIDPGKRLAMMDRVGVSHSVLVPLPWLETSPPVQANPQACSEGARILNDELAGIAARNPGRFSAVALLPTSNQEVMLAEFERAVKELGLKGGFYVVGPTVKPPDHPDYEALYAKAVEMDAPLWMHPSRPPVYPDYVGEKTSQYQIWQTLSWLMDSSAAMVRLVFGGLFLRRPQVKIIIHHHGALVPLFAQRMQYGWDYFEQNTGVKQPTEISRPYIDHFKNFYIDTATQGVEPLVLQVAVDFFGPERVLFGSDCPMDPENGAAFTRDALASVAGLRINQKQRADILANNARKLLKLS